MNIDERITNYLSSIIRLFATLICEAAAPFIEHSTTLTGVLLAPNGDFKIDDVLVPMPDGCASPVLLIRSANGGAWFAAGIPAAAGNSSHGDN